VRASRARRALTTALALAAAVAASCATVRRSADVAPPPPTVLEPPAEPGAAPPVAPAPPPEPARAPLREPEAVRIGLRTDLESASFVCCPDAVRVEAGGETWPLDATLTVRPAARSSAPPSWRLQVAALREPEEAEGLARRLSALASAPADARFDAGSGLFRVRVGGWRSRELAEQAGRRLQGGGLDAFWVVSEGGGLTEPALELDHAGETRRVEGRRVVLRAAAGGSIAVEGRRYRGAVAVFLNDRGRLNVVNELPLEQYLRGVVPSELGPNRYPHLEALKAQAIAARSYTLRNLGGFAEEGYDLCGTPKCQVYGGVSAEHPVSDRAVAETAGLVLTSDGQPIDALYSATCGGRTENVEVVFPLKSASYLRGVPCIEAGVSRLPASASAPTAWPPPAAAGAPESVREATFESLQGGALVVREPGGPTALPIGKRLATFRDDGTGPRAGELALAPGDRLELRFAGDELVAVVQRLSADAAPNDREHSRARWSRFRGDAELAVSVRQRYPGFEFAGLDVLERGPSGRVRRIRLLGRGGERVEVLGLAVRWVLDVPDTWFTVRRARSGRAGHRAAGWQFEGRGWGHGVGLCQVGAYGMARRGHDYRAILEHYYAGVELERLEPAAPPAPAAS
jgi:peptidoglycan hydrolase-like amidase